MLWEIFFGDDFYYFLGGDGRNDAGCWVELYVLLKALLEIGQKNFQILRLSQFGLVLFEGIDLRDKVQDVFEGLSLFQVKVYNAQQEQLVGLEHVSFFPLRFE